MKLLMIIALLAAIPGVCCAQDGTLDTTFDEDGIVLYLDAGYTTTANAVLVKPNGSILTVGERYSGFGSQLLMLGYQQDGQKDETFGRNNLAGFPTWGYPGIVHTDIPGSNREYAHAAVLQPDGKIVVAGYANTGGDWLIARYKPNGDLDSTFAAKGYFTQDRGGFNWINALVLLADGKILAGGTAGTSLGVARYNADGSPDHSFGNNGLASMMSTFGDGGSIALDGSNRIYLCGTDSEGADGRVLLGRFDPNGNPDNSFGTNGVIAIPSGSFPTRAYVSVSPDHKPVVASEMPANFGQSSALLISRFNTDGTADVTFNGNGRLTAAIGTHISPAAVLVQTDGDILVTGRSVQNMAADLFVAKFTVHGTAAAFGNGGVARSGLGTNFSTHYAAGLSITLQEDDKILIGGTATLNGSPHLVLARFHNTQGQTSGIFSATAAPPLTAYPNPARDQVFVDIPEGDWQEVRLTHLTGHLCFVQPVHASQVLQLPLEDLPPGLYCISLAGKEGRRSAKIAVR